MTPPRTASGSPTTAHAELLRMIRQVRRRWRAKHALRGVALALAAACVVFLISAYGMERFGFTAGAVAAFRILAYGAVLGATAWFVLRPLLRRISDERVALYLEEYEPKLNAALLSALELGPIAATTGAAGDGAKGGAAAVSPVLVGKILEDAVTACQSLDDGRAIERVGLRRSYALLAGSLAIALLVLLFGPASVRQGTTMLVAPWTPIEAAPAMRISVDPGNVTIARGADQPILAELHNFHTEPVELVVRAGDATTYQRWPMVADADAGGTFSFILFAVSQETEYFVEAGGVRSPTFRIDVAELPYVQNLTLEYHYPAYTGREPEVIEPGGDIAVLKGTEVRIRAGTTMPVDGGRIVLNDGRSIEMRLDDEGQLVGSMRVEADGYYSIELVAGGAAASGSPQYVIDVLEDRPPAISFTSPGRDTRVTAIDEVFVEARAVDDYGIASLQLHFSVNGGEERSRTLYTGGDGTTGEITGGHTFYLDEYDLQPGDIIAYYATASDGNQVDGSRTATSDIYFIEVRPFSLDYTQAEQAGGGGGGGGGAGGQQDDMDMQLSQRQRDLIAATFNVQRDSATYAEREYEETLSTLALGQERLREQVETLVQRMRNRNVSMLDTAFHAIMAILPQAARAMQEAEAELRQGSTQTALPLEQQALQHLLRAEAVYREVQVGFQQQQGGGGGGGGGPGQIAQDLADLFELELDQLRNQYETVQRAREGTPEQVQAEVDDAMERLRELARRQQQELERTRRRLALPPNMQGAGGGGDAQRQLAEEIEEEARRLERLARETQSQQLADAAREMQDAADALRRAAASNQQGGLAEAAAAAERLDEARRQLKRNRNNQLQQQASEAARMARELASQQREITNRLRELTDSGARPISELRSLAEAQARLGDAVGSLQQQLDRLAGQARADQQGEASRRLQEAASSIDESSLRERMRFSSQIMPGADRSQVPFHEAIAQEMEELSRRIADAANAIGMSPVQRAAEDMDRARDLIRGLESIDERQRERLEEAEQAARRLAAGQSEATQDGGRRLGERPGQDGQLGQQDQQGQQGQQGQSGQQDQQGGQGGQQQAGGGPNDGPRDGMAGDVSPLGGGWNDGGWNAGRWDGGEIRPFTEEEIRQYRAEYRERLAQAERLRQNLVEAGRDVRDLDRLIGQLRELDSREMFENLQALRQLQSEVIDGLKEFEFALRREMGRAVEERLHLAGSDDVPEEYRQLVEEYYRSLSSERR